MNALNVYLGARHAGILRRDEAGLSFHYVESYLTQTDSLPLSRRLPLPPVGAELIFDDPVCRAFFENLLPEGAVREQLAANLGLSSGNIFDLLAAVGGDCAGAVSVLPVGAGPKAQGDYRPISAAALAEELAHLLAHPFLADEEGVRLSLAGAQNKLPLFYDGEAFFIPWGGAPSSHILKTPIPHLENTVVNEVFCMNLARRVGLAVSAAEVIFVDGAAHYLVARYDRRKTGSGVLTRLHQEDFCQALGVPSERKYEKEGGPGFRDCFDLAREWSSEPLPDSAALLRWALFNFLIGNADAHGKNIAFLYDDGRVRLAPFYDLISTAVYERVNNKFAMRMGGEKDPRYLLPHHLERFAQDAGIGIRAVKGELRKLVDQIDSQAAILGEAFCARYDSPIIIPRILDVIHRRGAKARTLLV